MLHGCYVLLFYQEMLIGGHLDEKKMLVHHLGSRQSSKAQVYLYVLSVLLFIYSSPNFTELESGADIEYGSIDHSPECILSAGWALRQMPSL